MVAGNTIEELSAALSMLDGEGDVIVELVTESPVTVEQVRRIVDNLAQLKYPAKVEVRGNVVRITVPVSEGVGFLPIIPIVLGIVGVLGGVLGWRMMTAKASDLFKFLFPAVLALGGMALLYFGVIRGGFGAKR